VHGRPGDRPLALDVGAQPEQVVDRPLAAQDVPADVVEGGVRERSVDGQRRGELQQPQAI